MVAERFYRQLHWVWCTPHFDVVDGTGSVTGAGRFIAPTSAPMEIYRSLALEVRHGDRHSAKIRQNRAGIAAGADKKREAGVIDADAHAEILATVENSQVQDYRPVMYVIPFQAVAPLVRVVSVDQRAHPLSEEYQIHHLPRDCFDVVTLRL